MRTVFCFDVDGTLTTTEILPCIASELGIADEMATLTRATMDGLIPFEASFRLRCAILGQIPVARVRAIVASIPLQPAVLGFIAARPDDCILVTGNLDIWIGPIADRCGCRVFASEAPETGAEAGPLRPRSVLDKGAAIATLRAEGGFGRIVAIGDGANDLPMLEAADVAIAYGGVHPPAPGVAGACDYVIHDGEALCRLLSML